MYLMMSEYENNKLREMPDEINIYRIVTPRGYWDGLVWYTEYKDALKSSSELPGSMVISKKVNKADVIGLFNEDSVQTIITLPSDTYSLSLAH